METKGKGRQKEGESFVPQTGKVQKNYGTLVILLNLCSVISNELEHNQPEVSSLFSCVCKSKKKGKLRKEELTRRVRLVQRQQPLLSQMTDQDVS